MKNRCEYNPSALSSEILDFFRILLSCFFLTDCLNAYWGFPLRDTGLAECSPVSRFAKRL